MPSKNTIKDYREDSYYHIYNRGVEKRIIFHSPNDYKVFLSYLKLYLSPPTPAINNIFPSRRLKNYSNEINLVAYCLMPNHFHLLVKQRPSQAIHYFMRSLATKYAMYFNTKYTRIGRLFQGTYKAVLVNTESQLLQVSKYIHRNPINLLLPNQTLADYSYSSYRNYLHQVNQIWVKPKLILNYFSKTKPVTDYQQFVENTPTKTATVRDLIID